MSIPFTIDVSAFYGEPDFREQSSNTIVDRRKTLNLHKKLEGAIASKAKKTRKSKKQAGAIAMQSRAPQGGAIAMKEAGAVAMHKQERDERAAGAIAMKEAGAVAMQQHAPQGGAIAMQSRAPQGGAIAFNEAQLMNELTGLKKGGALPALAATVIPTLIQMAPQIIDAIKSLKKNPNGGAIKIGGASAVFLDGVDPSKYNDMIKTLKAIDRQKKNLIREGGAIRVGSGKMGTFFKNAWNNIKSWYGNNAERLKPITDILVNSAVNSANKMIDKGVKYVGDKTGSDTIKQIGDVVGNMAKNTVSDAAAAVQNYGSGYDIDNLDNTTAAIPVISKKKKILTAMPNNERKVTASEVSVKKSKSVYG